MKFRRVLSAVVTAAALAGCPGDAVRRGATVAVVGAGSTVGALRQEHERAYAEATDRLRESSRSLADYEQAVRPLNAAFDARTRALAIASTALYASATLIDLSRSADAGAWEYARAALDAAAALRHALEILEAPGDLPALSIPPEARARLRALESLGGGTKPL